MNAVAISPVGDYDLRGRKSSHRVYIGGFQPADDVLFIKVGMTSNMLDRIKAYAGMVPGGLSFMYSAKVTTRGEAISAERSMLLALSGRDEFEAVGGEWFRCQPLMKSSALDVLAEAGTSFMQERLLTPQPFTDGRRVKRAKRMRR
jgi:hypothetical protein